MKPKTITTAGALPFSLPKRRVKPIHLPPAQESKKWLEFHEIDHAHRQARSAENHVEGRIRKLEAKGRIASEEKVQLKALKSVLGEVRSDTRRLEREKASMREGFTMFVREDLEVSVRDAARAIDWAEEDIEKAKRDPEHYLDKGLTVRKLRERAEKARLDEKKAIVKLAEFEKEFPSQK